MGFSAGLYIYPKRNGDKIYTLEELRILNHYISYYHNEWALKTFTSAEEYVKIYNPENNYIPSYNDIAWAKEHTVKDEYDNYNIYSTIDSWCSSGGGEIHDIFKRYTMNNNEKGIITQEILSRILHDMYNLLYEYKFNVYNLEKAFQYKTDEEEEYQKVFSIDGIILSDDDGNYKEIWTGEESGIITSLNCYNNWEFKTLLQIIKILIDCLLSIDFDNEYLVYEGGW